jgi:hypothetical protein
MNLAWLLRFLFLPGTLLLAGGAATADPGFGVSEAEVATVISQRGLPLRLGNDTFREPMIESHAGSTRFYVYFYECNQTRTCQNIQFRTGFATRGRVTLAQVNDWSSRWRFGRMYLDPEGDVILDMDVDARRGLPPDILAAQLSRWLETVREAETFIGWGR